MSEPLPVIYQFTAKGRGTPDASNPKGVKIVAKGIIKGPPPDPQTRFAPFSVAEAARETVLREFEGFQFDGDTGNVTVFPDIQYMPGKTKAYHKRLAAKIAASQPTPA